MLWYRGYNVYDLIRGLHGKRFGFEEAAYLLLMGELPNAGQLAEFSNVLSKCRDLPSNFTRDVIMKAPTKDLMNSLTRSVLTLASYDDTIGDNSLQTQLEAVHQADQRLPHAGGVRLPRLQLLCQRRQHVHSPSPSRSSPPPKTCCRCSAPTAATPRWKPTCWTSRCCCTWSTAAATTPPSPPRVVTSSGSDTYSVMAAALCSLKGPKHGGANIKVVEMVNHIRSSVRDETDEEEVKDYLSKILDRQAFDHKGLIYGMGHAVYSLSDPRAVVFKSFVQQLALAKDRKKDFDFYNMIERLAPQVIAEKPPYL